MRTLYLRISTFLFFRFIPNRSLGLRRIMYLCQTVFLPFCRRRSGLRRDGTEEKTAAEGHKTARSNNVSIEIKTLRSNDRFGFMYCSPFSVAKMQLLMLRQH